MITHRILALGVVAGLLGLGAPAHAASGAVKGVLQLWEANGGHCPLNTAGRNCTGSNFTSAPRARRLAASRTWRRRS